MDLKIESLEDLILFVDREDVTVNDAIKIFSECLSIVPITFKNYAGDYTVNKSQTIRIIEKYIQNYQNGFIKKVVIFQSKP